MNRKISFVITLWWLIICGALGVCLLLFAEREAVVSQDENRTLSALPRLTAETVLSGGYAEAFEAFLCDKFFLRTRVVDAASAMKHVFSALTLDELLSEGTDDDTLFIDLPETEETAETTETKAAEAGAPEAADAEEQADAPGEAETAEEAATAQQVLSAQAGVWLESADGTRTALLTYSGEEIQKAADVFNAYAAELPEDGGLHVLLAPRAQTANKLALHTDTETGWSSDVEAALSALTTPNVTVYSVVDILETHMLGGEYVYFRTDHHWTALGAYYAAEAALNEQGYRTIYLHQRSAKLKSLADTVTVYEPLLPAESYRVSNTYRKAELPVIDMTQDDYKVYLGGTHGPYRVLDGGYHTGRSALVICDSFGNAFAPFLMPYYDSVYMVDFRDSYYTREDAQGSVSDYIRRCGISDIYVVLSESDGIATQFIDQLMPENLK
jgi:hypothetical protein